MKFTRGFNGLMPSCVKYRIHNTTATATTAAAEGTVTFIKYARINTLSTTTIFKANKETDMCEHTRIKQTNSKELGINA